MSLFKTIKHMIDKKINPEQKTVNKIYTPFPLDLHQDSAIRLKNTFPILQSTNGSIIKIKDIDYSVVSVGFLIIHGLSYNRAYLSDGKSFIEIVTDNNEILQKRFYVSEKEVIPTTKEQWNDFLEEGNGLIGWDGFQLDETKDQAAYVYGRAWGAGGAKWIRPVITNEKIIDVYGNKHFVKHTMMLYSRPLIDNTGEYLFADVVDTGNDASLEIYIGVELSDLDFTIFPATK